MATRSRSPYAEGFLEVDPPLLGSDWGPLLKAAHPKRSRSVSEVMVTLRCDTALLRKQMRGVAVELSTLPKAACKVAAKEIQRLLSSERFFKIEELRDVSARRAGEVVFRPRILRSRELVAAALRAANSKGFKLHRRAPVCAKGRRKPKASTGRSAS